MRIGLIAGNGRFPFLALDAARSLGHDVTVIAIRDEADPGIADAVATGPPAELHWVSLGQLGTVHQASEGCRNLARAHGRTGQAHQALRWGSFPI